METLATTISFILALSLSAERLIEIIKGFVPSLNTKEDDEKKEAKRKAFVVILSLFCGLFTSCLFYVCVPDNGIIKSWASAIAYGILSSGGSAFWNSILGYIIGVKELKATEAKGQKLENANKAIANNIMAEVNRNESELNRFKIELVRANLINGQ
ncbi:MAG: hypothetical protein C0490_00315 [Marivirga sp.]|nr:hypothetical protein [Marivirga sp.]